MPDTKTPAGLTGRFKARISGHAVILDVPADRYRLIPAWAQDAQSDAEVPAEDLARPPPGRSLWPAGPIRPSLVPEALLCLRRVARDLAQRPFADLVATIGAQPVRGPARAPVAGVLASYRAARPFFPQPWICRLDAPALCLLARRCGWPAALVFGARLEPFAAHCWVELGGAVLGEPWEQVQVYAPLAAF